MGWGIHRNIRLGIWLYVSLSTVASSFVFTVATNCKNNLYKTLFMRLRFAWSFPQRWSRTLVSVSESYFSLPLNSSRGRSDGCSQRHSCSIKLLQQHPSAADTPIILHPLLLASLTVPTNRKLLGEPRETWIKHCDRLVCLSAFLSVCVSVWGRILYQEHPPPFSGELHVEAYVSSSGFYAHLRRPPVRVALRAYRTVALLYLW